MKKILLTISLAIALNYSLSQTINSTNVVDLGDTVYNAIDVSPSISLGSTGTGNNWNFSTLLINSRDTVIFLHPYSIPCAVSAFPNATHSFMQDTNRAFLSRSSSALELIGLSNGTICVASQDPETIIEFPSVYSSTFMDTARTTTVVTGASVGQPLADSVKLISVTYIESDFNASGSLTTPFGVFTCIRQELERKTETDIYAKGPLTGGMYTLLRSEKDTSISHQYWSDAANAKFPLVSYEIDNSGNLTGSVTWTYKLGINTRVSLDEIERKNISVFPNPTSNQLTIDTDDNLLEITIIDLAGKTVYSSTDVSRNILDVSFLQNGVYVLSIKTKNYTSTTKFIKE